MGRTFVTTGADVPELTAPISHAVVVGPICYVSGQLPVDAQGRRLVGTAAEEASEAFKNVFAVLRAASFEPEEIAFIDIALADIRALPEVNAVFAGLFAASRRPARTVYQAAALPLDSKVKVQAVAIRDAFGGEARPRRSP